MPDPARWLPRRLREEVFEPARRDLRNDFARRRLTRGAGPVTATERCSLAMREWLLWFDCWRHMDTQPRPSTHRELLMMLRYQLRHAARLLWRDKPLTAAAVLTLALGLGANVAVFSIVEAVMLRPLPYAEADRLAVVRHRDARTGLTKAFIAIGDFVDIAARQRVFERLDAFGGFQSRLTINADPIDVRGLSASPGLFETLRVSAVAGRTFDAADARPGAAPVMMLSQTMWETQFGSDPSVIGRSLSLGNSVRQVVGIAPAGFRFPPTSSADVIIPIAVPDAAPAARKAGWLFGVGRLAEGVTLEQAEAQLASLSAELERAHPDQNQGSVYYTHSLRDDLVGSSKSPLLLMLAAVALVLLVACANVANLLLARAVGRRPEMALRSTLGAGRGRLAIQLFCESLVLGTIGLAAGLLVAYFGVPALIALVPPSVDVPGLSDAGLNLAVLTYAAMATLATTIVFGFVGLLTTGRQPGSDVLASSNRSGVSRQTRRWSSALVVVEIAFAAVLMVGAGLVLHSFAKLLAVNPGFSPDGVLVMETRLPAGRYQAVEARQAFYQQAFESLSQTPGLLGAGTAAVVPLTGNVWTSPFERADQRVPEGQRPPDVGWQTASRGYFEALGIPLKSGRLFGEADVPGGAPVVIISDELERRFFPGEKAVGKRIVVGEATAEVIGVVGSIRRERLESDPWADLYFPFEQSPGGAATLFLKSSSSDPRVIVADVQSRLRQIEPALAFPRVTTMAEISRESVAVTRLVLWLLGAFAVVALTLAAVGVYGVLAYQVRQRTREIGTRVALGATRNGIIGMILGDAGRLVAVGLVIGLGAGVAAARGLGALLFDVPIADPLTLTVTTATLLVAMAVACYLPARRAATVDPARTLSGS